jgi:carboxyl-terminal processing protease
LTRKRSKVKKHFGCGKKEKSTVPLLRNTNNFLQHFKKAETLLDKNQEEKGLIIDEIIKRYQYQEGFINIL